LSRVLPWGCPTGISWWVKVRKEQEAYFTELAKASGKPVALLGFEEMVV